MSPRHLSRRMACGLSKWDTEKANRLFIHVLIWWLFLSLLSHFHFKCQRTSFGLCQNAPRADREDVTALTHRDGSFGGSEFSISFSCQLFGITSWIWTKLEKGTMLLYNLVMWSEKISRECAVSGGGRSCVMADEYKPGEQKRNIVNITLFAWV